ncbi:unnamed protein product [Peronospora farinosa]|uniref:WW domain-containing protein n=1 Tax=Peronospora farinosa TaxID=134698 RepID=A0AAV0SRX7_9STRA|nr:unnamed protein product [Peronospora farinosa]CAI5706884.1 unnamed protein product [Peronospora farinosa]
MPPKSAVIAERLKKEFAAQKTRAEALKHLQATGSGPSQRELTQQQQLRQRQVANATSCVAQRRVGGGQPQEMSAADKFDPRVRDNTLHAVALRRAQELQKTHQIEQMTERYRLEPRTTEYNALHQEWQEVVDPVSGDSYFWNEATNKTVWERPRSSTIQTNSVEAVDSNTGDGQLAVGWKEVPDATSGDVYYWNQMTNETTWTRPVARSVSLGQAIEAKAKLDSILKKCGKTKPAKAHSSASVRSDDKATSDISPSASRDAASNSSSSKRPAPTIERPKDYASKRRKQSGLDHGAIDPMDPTGTGGKWSEGIEHA